MGSFICASNTVALEQPVVWWISSFMDHCISLLLFVCFDNLYHSYVMFFLENGYLMLDLLACSIFF